MWRGSLKFQNNGHEEGFLHYSAERLLSGVIACASTLVFSNTFLLVMYFPYVLSWLQHQQGKRRTDSLVLVSYSAIFVMWLMGLTLLAVAKTRRLHDRATFVQRERIVIGAAILVISQEIFARPWYVARLAGVDYCVVNPTETRCQRSMIMSDGRYVGSAFGSESVMLLALSVYIMAIHFMLSIRWIVALLAEVTVVVLYAVAGLWLGSPEADSFPMILCMLMVLMLLASLGKRQLEYSERMLFTQLLAEREMRAQAEFKLSQTQVRPRGLRELSMMNETSSNSTGHQTSIVGRILEEGSQAELQLEPLAEIGRREQWLLDATDLTISSSAPMLGSGGFGLVASGRYQRMLVAVKLVKGNVANHSLAHIGNELRILRKLHHPNIVLFHGACMDFQNGEIVLVLERVFGIPLGTFVSEYHAQVDRPAHSVLDALHLLLGACLALVYLHARQPPIVHGDLKDANIFVERRCAGSHAKLLDFGLARVLSRKAKPLGGTLRWKAPEVFVGSAPTPAADVFAFGRVIYYVLVGMQPLTDFDRKAVEQAGVKRMVLPLAWPQELSAEVRWCRPLILETSKPSPVSRPHIKQVCKDLEDIARSVREGAAEAKALTPLGPAGELEIEGGDDLSLPSWSSSDTDTAAVPPQGVKDSHDFWACVRKVRQDFHVQDVLRRRSERKRAEAAAGPDGKQPATGTAGSCHRESL